jgi:Family of unknown function (DUF6152)
MRLRFVGLALGMLCAAGGSAVAHHSMAMFDQQNPIELNGVVQDFRFVSPHTFILLDVKGSGDAVTTWSLEGDSPSHLARDGWTSKSLKTGDQVKLNIAPLRSGAPGGFWTSQKTFFQDGKPIVEPQSQ